MCPNKVLVCYCILNLSEPETFLHVLVVSMHPLKYELVYNRIPTADDSRSLTNKPASPKEKRGINCFCAGPLPGRSEVTHFLCRELYTASR